MNNRCEYSRVGLGILILIVYTSTLTQGTDLFTALVKMPEMISAEKNISEALKHFVQVQKQRIDELERISADLDRHVEEESMDPEKHLANPINAFLLIKRLSVDLPAVVVKYFGMKAETDFLDILSNMSTGLPNKNDLRGAAEALMRLQDTYSLSTDILASGQFAGVKATAMSAEDCFQVGIIANSTQDWYHSILWLSKALLLDDKEEIKTANRSRILENLSYSTFMRGNTLHAYTLTMEWLTLEPNNEQARQNINHLTTMLQEVHVNLSESQSLAVNISNERVLEQVKAHDRKAWKDYERLCRGVKNRYIDERKLTCQYKRHHPMFFINPLREEVLYHNPRIVIYRDVVTESEMDKLKELASPKLHRSTVFAREGQSFEHASFRTSQSGWVADAADPRVARLSQRIKAFTNLTLETTEDFQVLNYGMAGHYEPHYDFSGTDVSAYPAGHRNRILTTICYLSDVEAGGRTVFNILGVGVPPEKGSCVVWHNLLRNGKGDNFTLHAGCPVLSGNKWAVNKWFHEGGQEFTRPCSLSPDE